MHLCFLWHLSVLHRAPKEMLFQLNCNFYNLNDKYTLKAGIHSSIVLLKNLTEILCMWQFIPTYIYGWVIKSDGLLLMKVVVIYTKIKLKLIKSIVYYWHVTWCKSQSSKLGLYMEQN